MRAWRLRGSGGRRRLTSGVEADPTPGEGELLVGVDACGVCRTDLHLLDGDLPLHRHDVVPGHEIVGTVIDVGAGDTGGWLPGERVGVPWLRHTCGDCRYCRSGRENLCRGSRYTSWDADGGFADMTVVPAAYALRLPGGYRDTELAPLLCAGIIGHRALSRANVPDGGLLGIYGFGASAHLTAQVAIARGATVHVMTRDRAAAELAEEIGAESVQGFYATPEEPLDAAVVFAPVGDVIPRALGAIRPGGTVVSAGIHMSQIPALNYRRDLFHEKDLRSVEANTREDAHRFLEFAETHRLRVHVTEYPLDKATVALDDLRDGAVTGAAVLTT
ncbi:zinc-binding alcohol dehydrogenase family protein [Williamsia sp. SKLECPSW1]